MISLFPHLHWFYIHSRSTKLFTAKEKTEIQQEKKWLKITHGMKHGYQNFSYFISVYLSRSFANDDICLIDRDTILNSPYGNC